MKEIPLKVYSYYNFLNSTISFKKYIEFLKENKIEIAPLLSKESVFGIYKFFKLCKQNSLKPIIGTTFSNIKIKNRNIEITILPKTIDGYKNMNYLSSIKMNINNKEINIEYLKQNYKDIIVIVSLNKNINLNNFFEIKKELIFLKDLYWGKNEKTENNLFKNILKDKEIKLIDFKSVKVLKNSEKEFFKILQKIKNPEKILKNNLNIFSFFETFNEYNENIKKNLIKNQNELISKINLEIPIEKKLRLNNLDNNLNLNPYKTLENICFKKLEELKLNENYKTRLIKELKLIKDKNFSNYFLIVKNYIDFAIQNEIIVGPGRGSAPGSLICYLLNITKIDPIKYNLLFERFLNKERKELPDIDTDFQDNKRNEVIKYIFNKYKNNNVGLISTFQKIGIKLAIRDVGRALGINLNEISEITKKISVFYADNLEKNLENSIELRYKKEKFPKLFKYVKKIIGFPRQQGIHAAGIVISDINLNYLTGTWNDGLNTIIQMDMKLIKDFGLIKMDILGLRNLTLISNILNKLNVNNEKNKYLENIKLNDNNTFQLLKEGKTKGIFQLESSGMTELIKKIKPKEIEDIALTISLFRPGSIKYIDYFLERKNKNIKYKNLIPEFYEILNQTQGIPIFQEQIIKMVQVFSGLSAEKSDILRRAISKKNQILFESFKNIFYKKSKENNRSEELINKIWKIIIQFAKYGFNRSHAMGYSFISYWMAYLKTKNFNLFFTQLLNSVIGDDKKTYCYLKILKQNNILINLPSINRNIFKFINKKNEIFLPLLIIKKININFYNNLKKEREKNKNFKDIFDFFVRMSKYNLTKNIYFNLVYSGSLDSFNIKRLDLIKNYETLKLYFNTINIKKTNKVDFSIIEKPKLQIYNEKDENLFLKEEEVFGFKLK